MENDPEGYRRARDWNGEMGSRGIFRGMEFYTQRTLHPETNKKSKGGGGEGQKTFKVFTLKVFLRKGGGGDKRGKHQEL